MAVQKGTVSVTTENIFPIIKQYLYSDQEIFLRELVSNGVDATQKLKTIAARGQRVGQLDDLTVQVRLDKDAGTLTISDKGIGMTKEEVEKYITQIAFSSAQEFLKKYEDANTVIGHFGLGFFSGFMVSDKVEIKTLSYQENAKAVHWTSEGGIEYTIEENECRAERGTDIILHLSKDAEEYLEESRVEGLLTKYCRFLPVNIQFGTKTETINEPVADGEDGETVEKSIEVPNVVNDTAPLWTKKPNKLTDEEYLAFYKELYPYSEEPLFWIHLNVDYPFKLTGILYFPKIKNNLEIRKDRISLYCNQVFVTDHIEEIIPEFLTLLHGVIDSPDIPLNVSRSYLQSDPEVKKINKYIARKVADKLHSMFKNDRKNFEEKWQHTSVLIKYGILSDEKFADRAKPFTLFEGINSEQQFYTLPELQEATKATQTDKNGKLICLYASNIEEQHSYIETAKAANYSVLKFDTLIDPHYIQYVESKNSDIQFKRVDADTLNNLIEKDDAPESVLSEEETTVVNDLFTKNLDQKSVSVLVKAMLPTEAPVLITRPEFMRRMKDMSALSNDNYMSNMPDMYNVVINANHATLQHVLKEANATKQNDMVKQLCDLALLQQGMLKGEALTNFINRSIGLVK